MVPRKYDPPTGAFPSPSSAASETVRAADGLALSRNGYLYRRAGQKRRGLLRRTEHIRDAVIGGRQETIAPSESAAGKAWTSLGGKPTTSPSRLRADTHRLIPTPRPLIVLAASRL